MNKELVWINTVFLCNSNIDTQHFCVSYNTWVLQKSWHTCYSLGISNIECLVTKQTRVEQQCNIWPLLKPWWTPLSVWLMGWAPSRRQIAVTRALQSLWNMAGLALHYGAKRLRSCVAAYFSGEASIKNAGWLNRRSDTCAFFMNRATARSAKKNRSTKSSLVKFFVEECDKFSV